MPLFSVIIPTCNRNEMLGLCLERLASGSQTISALQYQVIVTDDGSGEGAEAFCKKNFPWVTYTHGPKRGPAANRNNGAQKAVGEWLVFTDDDCLPDANWLSAYAEGINLHPECNAFEGAILPNDWNLLKKDMAECPVNDKGGCFWSANILIGIDLFFKIGGFDEQFLIASHEDKDIYIRLKDKTKITFIESASVMHPVRLLSLKDKLKKLPRSWENYIKYVRKFDKDQQKAIIRKSIFNHINGFCFSIINLKPKNFIYHIASIIQYSRLIFPKI